VSFTAIFISKGSKACLLLMFMVKVCAKKYIENKSKKREGKKVQDKGM